MSPMLLLKRYLRLRVFNVFGGRGTNLREYTLVHWSLGTKYFFGCDMVHLAWFQPTTRKRVYLCYGVSLPIFWKCEKLITQLEKTG